jgi:Arc/MetJ family transcription regulator
MPSSTRKGKKPRSKTPRRRAEREGKVRKEFWLDPDALAAAQEFLGTATERETVEAALDLVGFRRELAASVTALAGLRLSRLD